MSGLIATLAAHHRNAAAAIPWYLAGGLIDISNVVAAWDLTQSASYATDLIGSANLSTAVGSNISHDGSKLTIGASSGIYATVATSLIPAGAGTLFIRAKGTSGANSGVLTTSRNADTTSSSFFLVRVAGADGQVEVRTSWNVHGGCDSGSATFDASSTLVVHSAAFVFTATAPSNWKLYQDGSDTSATNTSGNNNYHTQCLVDRIGLGILVRNSGNTFYPGDYYKVAIYNSTLTATQLAALHSVTT